MHIIAPDITMAAIAPALVVFCAGLGLLLLGAFLPSLVRAVSTGVSLAALVAAGVLEFGLWGRTEQAFSGALVIDGLGVFAACAILAAAILTVLQSASASCDRVTSCDHTEYHALLLFSISGMLCMVAANDLLIIYLGLEVMSIALYILTGFAKRDQASNEAAFKYLLLGGFSSGFFLYGCALLFGAAGSTGLSVILHVISGPGAAPGPMLMAGIALLLVGFGFKVSLMPFHMWTPDVYEGAPTAVTGFMATVVKVASFTAFARVFICSLAAFRPAWNGAFCALAVATMTVGNLTALRQENIKRMLAYSSIAHSGYLMVGMAAARHAPSDPAMAGILYYLVAYSLMTLGAFVAVTLVSNTERERVAIDSYAGMGFQRPLLAAALAVCIFSLAGIPPTAGFMGKFYVFTAAVKSGHVWLAVIAVLNSVLSLAYYLRIIVVLYMREDAAENLCGRFSAPAVLALAVAAVATLLLGLAPGSLMAAAKAATAFIP